MKEGYGRNRERRLTKREAGEKGGRKGTNRKP